MPITEPLLQPDLNEPGAHQPGSLLSVPRPLALVVFLENVGHVASLHLPRWVMASVDFLTEEYAKILLQLYGAYRRYDRVIILEDARATGPELATALLEASRTHTVDVLLLVHGHAGMLVGHRGQHTVGAETFAPLLARCAADPTALDLRMVYGLNCYGVTLAPTWLALGAQVANGALGVNWFPEPSLSVFLRRWLAGAPYSEAVVASNVTANRWWRRILRSSPVGPPHPWLVSSQQVVYGRRDVRIDSK
jgi:hypothetical protein